MRIVLFICFFGVFFCTNILYAQQWRRGDQGSDPLRILDSVAEKANQDSFIQDTQLNTVSNLQGSYPSEFRIANTLDALRIGIAPYLQWFIYIALALATIGIIYNGFKLVTGQEESIAGAQKNIINILIGVGIMWGFYIIIRLFVALLTAIVP